MNWWPRADGLNTGKVKDRSQDTLLPDLKQLRRNHSCLRTKIMKLSDSCKLQNQRDCGVLFNLRPILLKSVAGGLFSPLCFPLQEEHRPGVCSHPRADKFTPPALLCLPSVGPGRALVRLPVPEPRTIQGQAQAEGTSQR